MLRCVHGHDRAHILSVAKENKTVLRRSRNQERFHNFLSLRLLIVFLKLCNCLYFILMLKYFKALINGLTEREKRTEEKLSLPLKLFQLREDKMQVNSANLQHQKRGILWLHVQDC